MYFSHPSINLEYNDMQTKLGVKHTFLTKISDTRWNCRAKNCTAVKSNYKAIINVLEDEIDCSQNRDVAQAIGKT